MRACKTDWTAPRPRPRASKRGEIRQWATRRPVPIDGGSGRGPERLGADLDAPWIDRYGPRHAHDAGFDLHAGGTVAAGDRPRLERLACYVFRPPLAQHRLRGGSAMAASRWRCSAGGRTGRPI